jgi:uncharacterized protein YndB with AHSA1/START domain
MPESESASALHVRRVVPAPRDQVFKAWTDATALQKWWGTAGGKNSVSAEVDLRVGGKFRIETEASEARPASRITGTFLEVEPPQRLAYTWLGEGAMYDGLTLVTVEFFDRGGSTEIVLSHEFFHSKKGRDSYLAGWEGILEGLSMLFES